MVVSRFEMGGKRWPGAEEGADEGVAAISAFISPRPHITEQNLQQMREIGERQ